MNFVKRYLSATALLLAVLFAFGQHSNAQTGSSDVSEAGKRELPPANFVRSRDFDMRHIALDLRFDWGLEQTFGTARITLSPLVPSFRTLRLDAGLMKINSVKTDGRDLSFSYDEEKSALSIELDRVYPVGQELTVIVDYRTKGEAVSNTLGFGGGGGLKFFGPTPENPTQRKQIWSQGESEYNRYWFPSYDSPNDFATSELTATVEKPLMVISNGKLLETLDNADGTRTFHWKMDMPHANYLTSIVVGEYAEVKGEYEGIPVSSYVFPNELEEGRATTGKLPEMVRFFSETTGIKYPYAKYAQTMATGFNGGMENISATTMTPTMIHDERELLDIDSEGLQSHELAHQWFGDYVTTREWAHIWLNESFATYFKALWIEHSRGRDEFLYNDIRSNQAASISTWQQGLRRPIVTRYYADKDALFDTYAYPRGAAVLHMLRKHLGDELFFRALNYYLRKHANQPVETDQLRIAIEESTGQSMDWFFDQWLYKMGQPVFEVTKSFDASKKQLTVNVKQTQKIDPLNAYPQTEYFRTFVDIEIDGRIERVWIEPKAENVFTFAVENEPKLVDFDNESTLIKELKFEKSADELIYQLHYDRDVNGRAWALGELKNKLHDQRVSPVEHAEIAGALNHSITSDPFWAMRRDAVQAFTKPSDPASAGSADKSSFDEATLASFLKAAGDENSLVRAAAIASLGTTGDPAYADLYINAVKDRSYGVIDAASKSLAQTADPKALAALSGLVQTDSWRDRIRIAGLQGLADLRDPQALALGFKYAGKSNSSGVRSAALGIIAAVGKGDARAFPLILESFKTALENSDFQSIFRGFQNIIKLGDPRGQEAFDLAREKFGKNPNLLGFVQLLETQFKQALN